ncbi:MAG: rhomboid family intramembrane serine protease [Bifidobacteriaceae bacterium]|jgi:membrane associated rhomboid family serine protease|nr:rhomboid family intramembrane serine protease [Bifidobacteriaceae bacterium]
MAQHFFSNGGSSLITSLRDLFSKKRISYEWRNGGPVITTAILLICVAVWLVEIVTRFLAPTVFSVLVNGGSFAPVYFSLRPWTALTSMFLHSTSIFHIGFNMLTLWMVGPMLEKLFGHWQYFALYMISGLGGSMGLMLWSRLAPLSTGALAVSAYGASGAIFGLFAALLAVYHRTGVDIRSMIVLLVINFAMPFFYPNIAWQAHVGGFVMGGILTLLLMWRAPGVRKMSLTARTWMFSLILLVVMAVVMVWCSAGINALLGAYL